MAPSRHQRTQRAADTIELWDPCGSADVADWRRLDLVSERRLSLRGELGRELDQALSAVNRRRPVGATPHTAPVEVRWAPLHLDAAADGWRWALIIDEELLLPTRAAPGWVERGAAPPQSERIGTWWAVRSATDWCWCWYVGATTLEGAVRRALHATAPIDTTIRIVRSQLRHDLLVAVVDATPPGRSTLRLAVQDLGGRNGPGGRWGCLLADDLDAAAHLCT